MKDLDELKEKLSELYKQFAINIKELAAFFEQSMGDSNISALPYDQVRTLMEKHFLNKCLYFNIPIVLNVHDAANLLFFIHSCFEAGITSPYMLHDLFAQLTQQANLSVKNLIATSAGETAQTQDQDILSSLFKAKAKDYPVN